MQLFEVLRIIDKANREKMTTLSLSGRGIDHLPPKIGQMVDLETLYINRNQLTKLPPEIGLLFNLRRLSIKDNKLTKLPPEIGRLSNLGALAIDRNELTELPAEIGHLTSLTILSLVGNKLTTLPPEIGQLKSLKELFIVGNKLNRLPSEIGQLTNLTTLSIPGNQLSTLPEEIGQLTNLKRLFLNDNQLITLPAEIAHLINLDTFEFNGNPLTLIPPEIVQQGTHAVLAYLRAQLEDSCPLWRSKLIVVGQGGVGKTASLRSLRGEVFEPQLPTTHGLDIQTLELQHPVESDVTMRLTTWDFGGQDIYHATHQFFLTTRSLFLLVWNARNGHEQGKLYYWLDTIHARAPESPVLLLATHIDERNAELPIKNLSSMYPQIAGIYKISNKTGKGVKELHKAIVDTATNLPLMGEIWPVNWLKAAKNIHNRDEKYITPEELEEIMALHAITNDNITVLSQWLHELGDILYFQDDEELEDIVILKPQWVSQYISKILESEKVANQSGVLTTTVRNALWNDIGPSIRDHFIRLMERFNLSYRTLENREISLVVELLPLDPPDYEKKWNNILGVGTCHEISMKFKLNTIPAGIPTWFIARSHRFTTYTHWRNGALFADNQKNNHLALVKAFSLGRYIQLTVRGPNPHNFFALLKDGIEVTLRRFPGLKIERLIPCPGHNDQTCSHEFNYVHLEKAIERNPPVEQIQCPSSLEFVSVPRLLFGLHWSMQNNILNRLDDLEIMVVSKQDDILSELLVLRELVQREFTHNYRRDQAKLESSCPNVFVLRPVESSNMRKALIGGKIEMHLYCQAPGSWHPTENGGRYIIDKPAKWLEKVEPYIRHLVSVLKYVSPLVGPWIGMAAPEYKKLVQEDIEFMNELIKIIPDIKDGREKEIREKELIEENGETVAIELVHGANLRALRELLNEKDKNHHWGGLQKVLTPEGHLLWLCDYHAKMYLM